MGDAEPIVRAIEAALQGTPTDARPAPWLVWLAVTLCRQRARQTWLMAIAADNLANVEDDQGVVPGLDDWSYSFHGQGLCLSGPSDEHLDVDFHDDEGATIDPYFFAQRVLRLAPRPRVEGQLDRWFPTANLLVCGIEQLRRAGLVDHPDSDHVFMLDASLERLHAQVAAVDFEDEATFRQWSDRLGTPEGSRAGFHAWLRALVQDRRQAYRVLEAAALLLPRDEAIELCEQLLPGPIDATTGSALETLHRWPGPSEAVAPLLDRFDPGVHHPYSVWAAARYLLERDLCRAAALEAIDTFARVDRVAGYHGNPYADQLSLLMLEHCPERALPLLRRALRSSTPAVVETVAALLASLDQVWCHRELRSALADPELAEAPHLRRYLAAALAHSDSELARRRARMAQPPAPVPDDTAGFSFDQIVAANLDTFFGSALERAHPLAERLRERIPDDFGAGPG